MATVVIESVTAQHAEQLRAERDITPEQHYEEHWGIWRRDSARVRYGMAEQRKGWAETRRYWTQRAVVDAVSSATNRISEQLPDADLEGLSVTVTVKDLVATATATIERG